MGDGMLSNWNISCATSAKRNKWIRLRGTSNFSWNITYCSFGELLFSGEHFSTASWTAFSVCSFDGSGIGIVEWSSWWDFFFPAIENCSNYKRSIFGYTWSFRICFGISSTQCFRAFNKFSRWFCCQRCNKFSLY